MPDAGPSPGRTIAIGDIHGCAKALKALIQAIRPTPRDQLVTMGDYVDRGPDSREVIEQLIELAAHCRVIPLLGNHEIMMLVAIQQGELGFWLDCGGDTTLASYGDIRSIPQSHFAFLNACRRYYETERHIFVHANYQHDLPVDQQPEELLFWSHITSQVPLPHESGKTVIVGHTPQPDGEILDYGYVIGIDTYCFGTGWLTALDVNTGEVWQTDKEGTLRSEPTTE